VSEAARNVAAVAAALAVLGLLLPLPRLRSEAQRAAALAVLVAAWAVLMGSLVPEDDWRDVLDRLASPAAGGAAVVSAVVAIVLVVVGVRVVLARPTVWFVLLGIALPIRTPVSFGSQEANLLVPLYAVTVLGLAAFAWGRIRGRIERPAPEGPAALNVPLAALIALFLVSTLWSADPEEAAVKAGFFYLPFTVLYLLVLAWWPRARALAALAVTTIAGGAIAAAVALWQFESRDIWWNETLQQANVYSRFFRVNGIFFDPNILGRYLAIGILAALALAWVRRRPGELAALAAAVALMAAGLVVTYSRSSTLMLMVGLALLAGRAVGPRRAAIGGAALLIVLGGATIAASDNVRRAATDADRLERVSEGRFDLMKGGLEIWREEPIAGVGLGGFETRFEETLTPLEQRRVRVVISHNAPITILSETGLVGIALFIALIAGAGWAAVRGSRDEGDAGWARWALGAMLAGILVHSLLYAALFEDPFTWVIAGAAAAVAGSRPSAAVAAPPPPVTPEPVPVS
jgi:O-antigen ligase